MSGVPQHGRLWFPGALKGLGGLARPLLLMAILPRALAGQRTDWDPRLPPPEPVPSGQELQELLEGKVVYRAEELAPGRVQGLSMAATRATPEELWAEILDFDAYVTYLPYVTASRTLSREPVEGGERVLARIELTTLGIVTRYDVENYWFPEQGFLNWSMTPRSANPLQRVVGSWRVDPVEGHPELHLLSYRAEADMRWWVPDFLQLKARDRGLPVLVRLLRERAEARHGG